MVFSSPEFLFLFLPVVLVITLVAGRKPSNIILLLASLLFYIWGESGLVIILLISILVNYLFGLWLEHSDMEKYGKLIIAFSVVFNIGLLIVFKYSNFFVDEINSVISFFGLPEITISPIHLPIGISFYTFHSLSYLIDIYRGKSVVQKKPVNLALYIAFFPQLVAGPIVRYHDIAGQLVNRTLSINKFATGVRRFIIGMGKKVLIANTVAAVADQIFKIPSPELRADVAWLGIICYTLQIYFDFSGYSDMAIGLAKMFGFTFLENFDHPYISKSIREFWRRWHISLSTWFAEYLFKPLSVSLRKWRTTGLVIAILINFLLVGFWHGASWSFIAWGLFHGIFLCFEQLGWQKILDKIWAPISHFYTLFVVIIGWVFFRADDFTYAFGFIRSMFGFVNFNLAGYYSLNIYLNRETILTILAGIVFATPVFGKIKSFYSKTIVFCEYRKYPLIKTGLSFGVMIIYSGVFYASAMSLASGTYNPFIYFRF